MIKNSIQIAGAIALLAVSPSVHAYLDPSTGSMIVTAIVGLFASIALAVKTYWYKLKSFFRGKKGKNQARGDGKTERQDRGSVGPASSDLQD